MTAMEVLKAKGVPAALYEGKSHKELNALARAIDSTWKAPSEADVGFEVYEPKRGTKGKGVYLKVSTGGFGGIFERLCDGEKLTDEGKQKAAALLISISNQSAALVDSL